MILRYCMSHYISRSINMSAAPQMFGFPVTLRRLISNTGDIRDPMKNVVEAKRLYFYYINERGNLYHVYDIEPFVIALCRRFLDNIDFIDDAILKKSPFNGKIQPFPSGPSFLRDNKFLDFFFKRLRRNYSVNTPTVSTIDAMPYSLINMNTILPCREGSGYSSHLEQSLEWGSFFQTTISSVNVEIRASYREKSAAGSHNSDYNCDDVMLLTLEKLFPFVSLCGKELNFIACEKEPIVFHNLTFPVTCESTCSSIVEGNLREDECKAPEAFLTFAGTLTVPFASKALRVDTDGFMYHPLPDSSQRSPPAAPYGLVGATVGLQLGFNFVCDDLNQEGNYEIMWEGLKSVIKIF
eukprot:Tbor_TRINITY_DN3961_c0_g1::TRINITY_DN3961_c0_g1_i1::g.754::m.754